MSSWSPEHLGELTYIHDYIARMLANVPLASAREEEVLDGAFGFSRNVQVVFRKYPNDFGLTAPGTRLNICLVPRGSDCFGPHTWKFCAVRSGIEIPVYDERPDRGPNPQSGKEEDEHSYFPQCLGTALKDGTDLAAAASSIPIILDSYDPVKVREALSTVTFAILGRHGMVCRYEIRDVPKKRRRLTQKRLDGSEDITV